VSVVRSHDFNADWLGLRFGIAVGPELVCCDAEELDRQTAQFDVVEVRCDHAALPTVGPIATNGLVHVDTQLGYRLAIANVGTPPSGVEARPFPADRVVDAASFEFLPFAHERYARLAGVDAALLDARYRRWAGDLVAAHPSWCVEVRWRGTLSGYAFARPISDRHVNLDLVVGAPGGTLPGIGTYQAALALFGARGVQRVTAAFSAHNVAAVNVHAQLGCRITSATEVWFSDRRARTVDR